jgi:ubiquinone/menaquinone biosynthesis C-methylase UbiE
MQRVPRPGGKAVVVDLRKDASLNEIDTYVQQSGRSRFDAWVTKWAFRCMLIKRAYTQEEFIHMAEQSRFRTCQTNVGLIGFEVRFTKPARAPASQG